jgi:diguanylate cyclase (GGDEF)-like protein
VREARITRLAAENPLTRIPNRRVFYDALERISASLSKGEDDANQSIHFSIPFLDLDRFKIVNDILGHQIGARTRGPHPGRSDVGKRKDLSGRRGADRVRRARISKALATHWRHGFWVGAFFAAVELV